MGDLIDLAERRRTRPAQDEARRAPGVAFHFDLASPFTYFAAERVERLLPSVRWEPTLADDLPGETEFPGWRELRDQAEARAGLLRLPLVWPERQPRARGAMRVAALACERGRAPAFVLAASRLAWCGGFDLDDVEVLAEAAAAANIELDDCLGAAGDVARDGRMEAHARRVLAGDGHRLPALRVGQMLFCGEERVGEAAVAATGQAQAHLFSAGHRL